MKIALFVFMVTVLAQVFPSCGEDTGTVVVGWVEAKRVDRTNDSYVIVINNAGYDVPPFFWNEVRVGDLVKWDGLVWTIVKKAAAYSPLLLA